MNSITAAIARVLVPGRIDDLTDERATYAEIGRIVAIPFSVANVYERFAAQVAKIIPFELIVITHVDWERDQITLKYGIGLGKLGLSEGDTISLKESVVSEVANAERAILTDGYRYSGSLGRSFGASGLISRIATPLIANDKVIGTLHLASSETEVYGELELARLEIVGNQIAGAIASEILVQEERDRTRQLESLYSVAAVIAQPLSFEVKAQKIVDTLASIADADHVALRRVGQNHDSLDLVASANNGSTIFPRSLKIPDASFPIREAFLTGEPIKINDYGAHPGARPDLLAGGLASLYFVPITSEGRALGSISLGSKNAYHLDDGHVALIKAFSHEIFSLLNSVGQEEKLRASQEMALENERQNTRIHDGLYRISRTFAEVGDLKGKATTALEILVDLAGADWSTLRIVKDSEPGFHLAAAAGPATKISPPTPVISDSQVLEDKAFSKGELTVVDDYANWSRATQYLIDMGMQSLVFLPVTVNERILGVVSVISKKKNGFDQALVDLLTSVVDGLGNLLEISILQDKSDIAHKELQRLSEELSRSNEVLEDSMIVRTQELEAARDLAFRGEKLAVIGQLSAGMAHDLRNPLGAIRNATYLLKKELGANGVLAGNVKLNNCIEIIDNQVNKSNQSITDLMDFGKLKDAKMVETRLDEVLDQVLETLSKRDEVKFLQNIDSNLQLVMADGEQLQRVFLNLANNAQEAMPDGGCLTIAAKNVNGTVQITFSDTGEGISQENLEKIFDPLFTTKVKGTGLGLAVCLEIVERHGGTISAHKNAAQSGGTTFDVRFPAYS
jgi:signal transduction histidine kinase